VKWRRDRDGYNIPVCSACARRMDEWRAEERRCYREAEADREHSSGEIDRFGRRTEID
jgi:hypothetical protein